MDDNRSPGLGRGDVEAVILIELGRIYDLLSIIAAATNPEKTRQVIELHTQGKILAPPPAIEME